MGKRRVKVDGPYYFDEALAALPDASETLPGAPMTRLDAHVNDSDDDVDDQTVTLATSRTTL